jgi:hypothetical protein
MSDKKPLPVEILVGGPYTEPVHKDLARVRKPKVKRCPTGKR